MKTRPYLPGCLLATLAATSLAAVIARADTEDTVQKSFPVNPGATLVIDADRGTIEITPGTGSEMEISVKRVVTWGSEAKARKVLDDHQVEFTQDGGTVTVRGRLNGGWKTWGWNSPSLQVRYAVTLPRKSNVDLKSAGGTIKVGSLEGEVKANTSGGSIVIAAIEGPVTARTSGGTIEVESATGAVSARTSGGSIKLGTMKSTVDAETSGGTISAKHTAANARLATSGGSINVDRADGALDAGTSGGSIRAGLNGSPAGDCSLRTSGGSIRISLPGNASANIDASTSGGSVKSDLPVTVQGEIKRTSLVGKLGNGGPLIKARTSGGSIVIEKASW
jgi:hypothetical protein